MQQFVVQVYPPISGATPYRWIIIFEGKCINAGIAATLIAAAKAAGDAVKAYTDSL